MMQLNKLKAVSYLAPNWFWFYEAVIADFGNQFQLPTQLLQSTCDPLADYRLLSNQVDLAFICGLPFARYSQQQPEQLQAIAAPIMQPPRYRDRPVYFSDIIVSMTRDYRQLADLANSRFCYNDRGSNSGYQLLRDHLLRIGAPKRFFRQVTQSGSHQQSIRWVISGKADCAAIDSTVLERELLDYPEFAAQLRVLTVIEPCLIPPIVVAQHLGQTWMTRLQTALLQPSPELQMAMRQAGIQRFAIVHSADYQILAQRYAAAEQIGYEL